MSELLISLLAALVGVVLDRLTAWQRSRKADTAILNYARLRDRLEVDRINRAIDEDLARESSLDALIDRL